MPSHCWRMCPPRPLDLDNDCRARKRFPARKDRHDNTHHGYHGRHSKGHVQNITDQKRKRACSPAPVAGDDPEKLDFRAPPGHQAYLHYLEPRYKSEFQPSVRRDRFPIGSRVVHAGSPSCTRNRAQFAELRREPESAAGRAGFPESRHESASAFLVFARVCETPESPAAIAALLSSIPDRKSTRLNSSHLG